MLRTENLCIPLFKNLNLHFRPGTISTLSGKNGVGKSTLLNYLSGIFRPLSGHVYLNDQNLISLKASKRAQAIASIGQFDGAPGDMRVKTRIAHGASHIEKISEEFKITHL